MSFTRREVVNVIRKKGRQSYHFGLIRNQFVLVRIIMFRIWAREGFKLLVFRLVPFSRKMRVIGQSETNYV